MKSRTSFFDVTILKKDITRFAPVWALYTIFGTLVLLTLNRTPGEMASEIAGLAGVFAPISFGYALVCALLLFGDLFVPRMCNALHSLPLRREGWFLTHTAAGLLFSIVPNALLCGGAAMMMAPYGKVALLWFASAELEYLFFFGIAAFAALCTGSRLGMAAVYGIVNFFSTLIYGLIEILYLPLLKGVVLDQDVFVTFSPILRMSDVSLIPGEYHYEKNVFVLQKLPRELWLYLGVCAGIGVVFAALALLIYRRRQLETAGDFIALKPVAPVFLVLYTLLCGAFFYTVADVAAGGLEYVFLAVGIAVGFFTGRMLLDRTVKVFTGKSFAWFGILVAVLLGSIIVTVLDPLGITTYIPKAEDVRSVNMREGYYGGGPVDSFTAEDPEQIGTVIRAHELLLNENIGKDDDTYLLTLQYRLKNGRTVTREYDAVRGGEATQVLKKQLSSAEYLFRTSDWEKYVADVTDIDMVVYSNAPEKDSLKLRLVYNTWEYDEEAQKALVVRDGYQFTEDGLTVVLTRKQVTELMAAVKADCDAGNMAQNVHTGNSSGYVSINTDNFRSVYLDYYPDCTNITRFADAILAANP